MEIDYIDDSLQRMYHDPGFDGGFSPSIVKAYRKRVGFIAQATDERDIRNVKGNRLEKLSGRGGQHSVRLNDQWRLIVSFQTTDGKKTAVLQGIEDYH